MAIGLLNGNKEANEAFLRYQLDGIDSNLEEKFSEFTAYRQLEVISEILDNDIESNIEAVNEEEDSSEDSDDSDERRLQALIV
jgi:type I restriction-modification system DNA methylase subunit